MQHSPIKVIDDSQANYFGNISNSVYNQLQGMTVDVCDAIDETENDNTMRYVDPYT